MIVVRFCVCVALLCCCGFEWGFFAHKKINELAVFTLPPVMIDFYKHHIQYLSETSVAPDRRRYAVEGEEYRHYIDLDRYGGELMDVPLSWSKASVCFDKDTLETRGIVPWHIYRMYRRLREAFLLRDQKKILRISAELGHYVSDANVPLHTTENYNGQLTGQSGIHALWESRLPELFFDEYDFFVGKASYVDTVLSYTWRAVWAAHHAVDSVLQLERNLGKRIMHKKYSFETRGKRTIKTVSLVYAKQYHTMLDGMVERQMRASVKMTGDLWYTAWVDAGQPDLNTLLEHRLTEEERKEQMKRVEAWKNSPAVKARPHNLPAID